MSDTIDTPTTGQKFTAEALGTFVLVFFGCGAAMRSGGDYVATGLTFGLTVVVMAYAVGRISGGHFNPAVTLGAVLGGRLPWNQVGIYMAAQLLGGLARGRGALRPQPRLRGLQRRGQHGAELLRRPGHRLRLVGRAAARDPADRGLPLGDPRGDRRAQRGQRGHGPAGHRPGPGDDPLRVDERHRHLGQPGPLHRRGRLRRHRRDHPALAVRRRAAGRCRDRRPDLPRPLRPGRRSRSPAPASTSAAAAREPVRPRQLRGPVEPGPAGRLGPARRRVGRSPAAAAWGQPAPQQQPDPRTARRRRSRSRPVGPARAAAAPQQPGQPGQWGAPPAQQPQPGQPGAPGHWGNPEGDDDGRTQVRRPD